MRGTVILGSLVFPRSVLEKFERATGLVVVLGIALTTSACVDSAPQQSATMSPTDEVRARLDSTVGGRLVLRTIEAHGGLEAWHAAPTSSYAWEYSNTGSNTRFKTHMTVDNRSRKAYHELLEMGTLEKPQPASGRFAWDGEEAWISPASLTAPNPRFWSLTGFYFQSIPFVLADPGIFYRVLPDEELDGIPHDMVAVSYGDGIGDSPGDTYTLYVNKTTNMVDAIRYTVTFGRTERSANPRETLMYYLDYETIDDLTVPTRFEGYSFSDGVKGAQRSSAWVSDISFRQPFDAIRLERPDDARVELMPGS